MRTLGAVLSALALALVTGCGEQSTGSPPPSAAQWHDCTVDDFTQGGRVVARGDADEGTVRVTARLFGPADGPCSDGLVLRDGDGVHGADVGALDLAPARVRLERMHGTRLPVLVAGSRPVARGGVQTHLLVPAGGGRLAELTRDGSPLLPFVATDTGTQPLTATCEPGGRIAVWTARASQPPGIVLAWDVRRTTYEIEAGQAVEVSSDLVEDATVDPTLRKQMPRLFEPGAFLRDC
jgi:hypothetical protein